MSLQQEKSEFNAPERQSINLQAVKRSVQRHWVGSFLIVLVVLALAIAYLIIKTPIYRVMSSVLIENRNQSIVSNAETGVTLTREVSEAQRILACSTPVLKRALELAIAERPKDAVLKEPNAVEKLYYPLETTIDGQLLVLYCYDADAARVTTLANAWQTAFVNEMIQRERSTSRYTSQFLDEQVPKLREKWYAEQVALQEYLVKSKYDPKEWENHPVRKRYAHFSELLTDAQARQSALQNEAVAIQRAAKDPDQLIQSPRARKDINLLAYEKMVQDQQKVVLDTKSKYTDGSDEVKKELVLLEQLEHLRKNAVESLGQQISVEVSMADDDVKSMNDYFETAKADVETLNSKAAEYQRLAFQVEMARRQYEDMLGRLNSADLAGQVQYSYAKPWQRGELPKKPYLPSWPKNMAFGLVIGVLFGMGFIYLREVTDTTVHSDAQLTDRLGIKVLGTVPLLDKNIITNCYHLLRSHPRSLASENLRSIRMSLWLACQSDQGIIIITTSASQADGKSVVSSNLAVAFAEQGRRTLLVDGDIYKGTLSTNWDLKRDIGLSILATESRSVEELIVPSGLDKLSFLPIGKRIANPAMVWESKSMPAFFDSLRRNFDVVIIDCPPLLAVSDSQILAQRCDAVLVVVRSRVTQFLNVQRSIDALQRAHCKQSFYVVNGLDGADAEAAGYGYGYGYGYGGGYGYGYGYGATTIEDDVGKPMISDVNKEAPTRIKGKRATGKDR